MDGCGAISSDERNLPCRWMWRARSFTPTIPRSSLQRSRQPVRFSLLFLFLSSNRTFPPLSTSPTFFADPSPPPALVFRLIDDAPDGQQLSVASRELGNTEVYAQTLQHSPNGR